MLRAGNSGDGMADLSGCAAAPVRQRLEGFWRGAEGRGRNQPEATEEPDGTIRETSNVSRTKLNNQPIMAPVHFYLIYGSPLICF